MNALVYIVTEHRLWNSLGVKIKFIGNEKTKKQNWVFINRGQKYRILKCFAIVLFIKHKLDCQEFAWCVNLNSVLLPIFTFRSIWVLLYSPLRVLWDVRVCRFVWDLFVCRFWLFVASDAISINTRPTRPSVVHILRVPKVKWGRYVVNFLSSYSR